MSTELFETGSGATFSGDNKYRYSLWRVWDESLPRVMCIGLNPSTANGVKNDNTISLLISMFKKLGYGGFYMMNCFAFITSKPELLQHNPASDQWNNDMITVTAARCQDVVFAWGSFKVIGERGRDKELIEMFPNAKCFGKSANGSPWHPRALLYNRTSKSPTLIKYE